jgi:hypothetical protein
VFFLCQSFIMYLYPLIRLAAQFIPWEFQTSLKDWEAFRKSWRRARPPHLVFEWAHSVTGTVEDLKEPCAAARALPDGVMDIFLSILHSLFICIRPFALPRAERVGQVSRVGFSIGPPTGTDTESEGNPMKRLSK